MGAGGHTDLRQSGNQGLRGGFQRIHLHRQRRHAVVGGQEGLRLLPAQQGQQPFHQPLGMAVPDGQIPGLVPVRDVWQVLFVLGNFAQHRVHKTRGLSPLAELCQLHGGVHRRAVRHLVQKQDLIGANAQDVQQGRLQMVRLLGAVGADIEVQQQPVLHGAIHDAAAKGRVGAGQAVPTQLGLQGGVRPGAVGAAADQHPQGGLTGGSAHRRPPPCRLSPFRPRKMSTNRSSCKMDISSAAT